MSLTPATLTTRSENLFAAAFNLAIEGNHRESDELLEMAHEMRELEQRISHIALHAPANLALLLVKSAMTGFSDDADASEYVAENRETIQFYADSDAQLRSLIDATFNPPLYKRNQFQLSSDELEAARLEIGRRSVTDPGRKAVSDPVITPAAVAIAARGFKEFTSGGRCSILRQCPECRNKYSTKVHFNSEIYWHCPHCNTIKEA
jgi:hypothetical protein